jgi:hypothetical protein
MTKIMIWCSGVALAGVVAVGGPAAARTAGSHGGTASSHGGTAGSHGGTASSHGGTAGSHGGTASSHGGTAGLHGGTAGLHGGTIGSWGKAIEVPGLAALNTGGDASVTTISCPWAGNCTAAGDYSDRHDDLNQGFVVDERNGRWGKAIAVPGLVALNKGEYAEVNEVACGSAGNCAVGGFYSGPRSQQGFLAVEQHGHWGKAIDVPGLVALNKTKNAEVDYVSCGSAGNCLAGGFYSNSQIGERAFEIVERNGVWGTAIEIPGLAALDTAGYSAVESESCAPAAKAPAAKAPAAKAPAAKAPAAKALAGKAPAAKAPAAKGSASTCAVSGYYTLRSGNQEAFLASVRNGRWTSAITVPAPPALKGDIVDGASVSCPTARNCTAVGDYEAGHGHGHAYAVAERNGRWSKAIQLPGLANQGKGGGASPDEVSCGSARDCAVGGIYQAKGEVHEHGIVAVERNGRWSKAIAVPGLAALNKGRRSTEVLTLSCDRASNCAAGGFYFDRPGHYAWFVAVERNGHWGKATEVPGLAALNNGQDGIDISDNTFALSCAPKGACAAGGLYVNRSGDGQAFVTQPRR